MTREEICDSMTVQDAVRVLKETNCYGTMDIAKSVIIKALEQQPDGDCISRKSMLEGLANIAKAKAKSDAQKSLMGRVMFFTEHLPSVTPQPIERTETHACDCVSRKGHWITQWNAAHQKEYYYCSECREEFSYDRETGIKMNDYSYCPNCGSCNRGRKE